AAVRLLLGALVIVILMRLPNGLASLRLPWRGRPGARAEGVQRGEVSTVEPLSLEASHVTVRYGAVVAVDDVSLTLRPGQVVGLIGPNGAGKTTLIDALTGFARVTRGEILLDGRPITRWSARRRAVRGIGRSFQSLELFESMSVRE